MRLRFSPHGGEKGKRGENIAQWYAFSWFPSYTFPSLLRGCSVLAAREAMRITRAPDLEKALCHLAREVPLIVVKLGPEGALACRGSERVSASAVPVECFDCVGAGDSFDAGFLSAYLRGAGLAQCLESGNVAGALSVTRPGGTEAFRDESHREWFLARHSKRLS